MYQVATVITIPVAVASIIYQNVFIPFIYRTLAISQMKRLKYKHTVIMDYCTYIM